MSVQALKCISPKVLKLSAVLCAASALGGISGQLLLSLLTPHVQQGYLIYLLTKACLHTVCVCVCVYTYKSYMWVYFLSSLLKSTKIASVSSFTWKKRYYFLQHKENIKVQKAWQTCMKTQNEGINQSYPKNFYLKQTSNQPTSEGYLVWEGILPPDFATFSEAKKGIKFETCNCSQFQSFFSFSSKQGRGCNQYAQLTVCSGRLSQQRCRENVLWGLHQFAACCVLGLQEDNELQKVEKYQRKKGWFSVRHPLCGRLQERGDK